MAIALSPPQAGSPTTSDAVDAAPAATHALSRRFDRIEELRAQGRIGASTYFGMRFFHGIESAVKKRSTEPGPRAIFDAVTATLRARTMTRGHAARLADGDRSQMILFDERAWEHRGLGLDPRPMAGFADLVDGSAQRAGELAGVEPTSELPAAFQAFVRLDLAVRAEDGEPLGGEPDSANFFSFAEQAFWRLDAGEPSAFWLALARAAVAAQPTYLAVHFLKARRAPRRQIDYGPDDVLRSPRELTRRLSRVPVADRLEDASVFELAYLAGENARVGFLR